MKTVFVFDTILLQDKKNDYYAQTLTYDFFKSRYLNVCDKMIITTRCQKIEKFSEQNNGYRKTNGNNISVCPISNYNDIPDAVKNKKKIKKEMDNIVKNCDNLIIRMPSILGLFACKSAKKYNKNYLIEMVACAWDGYMNHARFGGKILAPIMYLKTRNAIQCSPNVLYVTERFLQRRYPNKHNNIGCTDTILTKINDDLEIKRIEKLSNVNVRKLKLVTVASVQLKYKGQEYVMKAMNDLKRQGYDLKYYLIGGGNNKRLLKYVSKYHLDRDVIFLGSKSHADVFNVLNDMDLYIQPSLQEGLPRAVVEAMSVGLPVIASNAGGIPEIVEPQFVFKKKNTRQLKNILEYIDNEKLISQSKRNFEYSKKFMPDRIDKMRTNFYIEVLRNEK